MATYRNFIVLALLITTFAVAPHAKLLGQTGKPSTDAARSDSSKLEFFEKHVRPLLIEKCYECHSHGSGESDGDLFLDSAAAMRKGGSRGAVLVAGKPNQSLLMRVVNYRDRNLQMPPSGKLSESEIELLREWIESGATDPRTEELKKTDNRHGRVTTSPIDRDPSTHWAFNVPVRQSVDTNLDADVEDTIDVLAASAAEKANIEISLRADRETLIRRLYYDLTGLPPSRETIQSFTNSRRPDAYHRLVDRLLATPAFGERFGRHWLDVARYADTVGYALGGKERRYAGSERYRDWTIRSFAQDMPYDEMVRHQLSADRTDPTNENGNLEAMGFLTLGRQFLNPLDTIDDRIDVITRGLLGLTVACARCHDHKFDPIPTEDYYALGGIIASSQRPKEGASPLMLVDKPNPIDSPVLIRGQPGNRGPIVPRQFLTALRSDEETPFTDGSGRKELADRIATPNNPLTARVMANRVWSYLVGKPLVANPSDFGFRTKPPAVPEILDELAADFSTDWSIKKLVRRIVLSKIYQQRVAARDKSLTADPDNELLARGNRKRRDFESLRDSILTVSGTLDRSLGGPPVDITSSTPTHRRTIYSMIDRQNLPALFRTFDFASPDTHSPGRYFTTVPQQALFLMNSPEMMAMARATAGAIRQQKTSPEELSAQAEAIYNQILGRDPSQQELATATAFLQTPPQPPKPIIDPRSLWSYGTATMLPEGEGQPSDFSALKQYRDGRWQASGEFPTTAPFGHAYLGKTGGHTTSDPSLGVIRRYTAPQNEKVKLEGKIRHSSKQGDGVTFSIQTNGKQIYESTQLNSQQRHGPHSIKLNAGDVIDLIATPGRTSSFDSFEWTAKIQSEPEQGKGKASERDTVKHFSGPFETEKIQSLDRLEQLAQILILSNEFAFID
ncbi:MAG: PSD1 and planctomycete cytochrome C domain-containing protein [Rubripirellula sp.]